MKIKVTQNSLFTALSHIYRIVEKRNIQPILSNIHIKAEGGRLTLRATDLDIEISESTGVDVIEEGVTTIPAHAVFEIVSNLKKDDIISLESNDEKLSLSIKSGKSRFSLKTISENEFPIAPKPQVTNTFSLKSSEINLLIGKVRFASSTEETRYYLNGVYMHKVEVDGVVNLRCVATNGHILAHAQIQHDGVSELDGIIIPSKAVNELLRLTNGFDGLVNVECSENKISFTIKETKLTTKLIDGTFPDYQRIIPTQNNNVMIADKSDIIKSINLVSSISNNTGSSIKLNLTERSLDLSVANAGLGNASDNLHVDYNDENIDIGFNSKYLSDCINQIDSDTIAIKLKDSGSATIISSSITQDNVFYVIMPMRV